MTAKSRLLAKKIRFEGSAPRFLRINPFAMPEGGDICRMCAQGLQRNKAFEVKAVCFLQNFEIFNVFEAKSESLQFVNCKIALINGIITLLYIF